MRICVCHFFFVFLHAESCKRKNVENEQEKSISHYEVRIQ